jgi:hypothetical protein
MHTEKFRQIIIIKNPTFILIIKFYALFSCNFFNGFCYSVKCFMYIFLMKNIFFKHVTVLN